jgi:hypothetical protein
MFLDHGDEVCGSKSGQCGLRKVRVFGEKVFRTAVDVRKVAPAASGDEYFFPDAFGMVEQNYTPPAAACFDRAHHSCSACSQDYDIDLLHARSPLLSL